MKSFRGWRGLRKKALENERQASVKSIRRLWSEWEKEITFRVYEGNKYKRPRKSIGEGNGNSLQYSCLENPIDTGAWWATVYRVAGVGRNLETKLPPPESQQMMVKARQGWGCAGPQETGPGCGISFYGAVVCKHRPGGPSGHRKGGRQTGEESRVRKWPASQDSRPSNSASIPVAWPMSISYQAF